MSVLGLTIALLITVSTAFMARAVLADGADDATRANSPHMCC